MEKTSYLKPMLPYFCVDLFTALMPFISQLYKFIYNIVFFLCGIRLARKIIETKRGIGFKLPLIKMGVTPFAKSLERYDTIRYGAMLYLTLALLIIPKGFCSSQHVGLQFVPPQIEIQAPLDDGSMTVARYFTALEGVMDHAPQVVKKQIDPEPLPFHQPIMRASQTYDVDAALIRAIILAESNFNPQAVSRAGAQGLMQLMPRTARWLGVEDTFNPDLNIDGGVRYFKKLLDRFDGNVKLALAAYNAGSRHVLNYGGVPPFRATQLYIRKVLKYAQIYREQMAGRVDYT